MFRRWRGRWNQIENVYRMCSENRESFSNVKKKITRLSVKIGIGHRWTGAHNLRSLRSIFCCVCFFIGSVVSMLSPRNGSILHITLFLYYVRLVVEENKRGTAIGPASNWNWDKKKKVDRNGMCISISFLFQWTMRQQIDRHCKEYVVDIIGCSQMELENVTYDGIIFTSFRRTMWWLSFVSAVPHGISYRCRLILFHHIFFSYWLYLYYRQSVYLRDIIRLVCVQWLVLRLPVHWTKFYHRCILHCESISISSTDASFLSARFAFTHSFQFPHSFGLTVTLLDLMVSSEI